MKKNTPQQSEQSKKTKDPIFIKGVSLTAILTFIISFVVVLFGLCIIAYRGLAVKKIRAALPQVISSLNEIGLDIAYENIKFSPFFFTPLMQIKQPQLYTLNENNFWQIKFDEITAQISLFQDDSINLNFTESGEISLNNQTYTTSNNEMAFEIDLNKNKVQQVSLHVDDFKIKQFADIKEISFNMQRSSLQNKNKDAIISSWNSSLAVNNVTINGLVNYPLSSQLKQLSMQANVMGEFKFNDDFLISVENWVKSGGFIDIPNLVLKWKPLTLVGRGQCKFNNFLDPDITFNTSSKGLLKLLASLQAIKMVDNKNVYVAKILLNNKAYRLKADDEELTITTPISYSDGKITLDNLVIKDFNKDTQQ